MTGTWQGDTFTAADGREFAIFSEHVRGDSRFYKSMRKRDDSPVLAGERAPIGGIGSADWLDLPFDGSYSRVTVKRAVERYVRETTERSNG